MTEDGSEWRAVARLSEIPDPGLTDVELGRRLVLLVRQGQSVRAYQGLCPHQFARLAGGHLEGEELRCPQHMARFRLEDGVCTGGWALSALERYAVRVEGEEVQLQFPLHPL